MRLARDFSLLRVSSVAAGVIPSWCTKKGMQFQQKLAFLFPLQFTYHDVFFCIFVYDLKPDFFIHIYRIICLLYGTAILDIQLDIHLLIA